MGTPGYTITLDYAPSASNEPRWGYDRPSHARLARAAGPPRRTLRARAARRRRAHIDDAAAHRASPSTTPAPEEPAWINGFLPGPRRRAALRPAARAQARALPGDRLRQLDEVRCPRPARRRRSSTHLTSIDPVPRAEIDTLCDEVIRAPLEARRPRRDQPPAARRHAVLRRLAPRLHERRHRRVLPRRAAAAAARRARRRPRHPPARRLPARVRRALVLRAVPAGVLAARREPARAAARSRPPTSAATPRSAALLDPLWTSPGFEAVERHGDAFWFTTGQSLRDRATALARKLRRRVGR